MKCMMRKGEGNGKRWRMDSKFLQYLPGLTSTLEAASGGGAGAEGPKRKKVSAEGECGRKE